MIESIIYLAKIFKIATKRFIDEKYTFYVSALTLTTFLSIVPMLSVSVFLLTKFTIFSNFISISEQYILRNFVPTSASAIQGYLQNFIQQALHLPIISILFLILAAIMMINTIDDTINDIWKIAKRRRKILVWLIYSFILLTAPIVLGLSIFLTSYLFSLYFLSQLNSVMIFILPILLNTIIFSMFYIYGPNIYVKKTDGFLAGFTTAVLLETARTLFALWISYFSNYELIYGAFALLPIFICWLYICWFIILWGALVTYTLSACRIANEEM